MHAHSNTLCLKHQVFYNVPNTASSASRISDLSSSDSGNETKKPSFHLHREEEKEPPLLIGENRTDANGGFRITLPLPVDGNESRFLILAVGADGQSNGSATFYSGLEPATQR